MVYPLSAALLKYVVRWWLAKIQKNSWLNVLEILEYRN